MIKCVTKYNFMDILNRNIYIYGAGVYAEDIDAWLARVEIQKVSYIVDDEYLPNHSILGKDILSLSAYKSKKTV